MTDLPEGPYRRQTARVLLLNAEDRVLLFRFPRRRRHRRPWQILTRPQPPKHSWLTPGGGVNEGEDLAAAAARELFEETNLRVAPEDLGAPVAATAGWADLGHSKGVFRDEFFLHRVDHHEVDMRNSEGYEPRIITEIRWWSLPELAASTERIIPFGLAPLLSRILTEGRPAEPVALPWHHATHRRFGTHPRKTP